MMQSNTTADFKGANTNMNLFLELLGAEPNYLEWKMKYLHVFFYCKLLMQKNQVKKSMIY